MDIGSLISSRFGVVDVSAMVELDEKLVICVDIGSLIFRFGVVDVLAMVKLDEELEIRLDIG